MAEWATTTRFETNWHQYWYDHGYNPEWLCRLYTLCANKGIGFYWPTDGARVHSFELYYKERQERERRILPDGAA